MSENKKQVQIKEGASSDVETADTKKELKEKLKKPVIFALMGIAFLGCMFLIFKPSSEENQKNQIGLNDAVPGASEAGLQSDKQKAYEQELMEQKELEKRQSLMSLSDYWNQEIAPKDERPTMDSEDSMYSNSPANASINSYRSAQSTLGNFYQHDNSYETEQLKKEIEELRTQLSDKESQPSNTVESQLALMEKSYEMAAKYLPTGAQNQPSVQIQQAANSTQKKDYFVSVTPKQRDHVSSLYREPSDSAFLENINSKRNRGFFTVGIKEQKARPKNSLKAIIQQTQTVTPESTVQIRLLENAETPDHIIPKGTVLTAVSKFQGNRLQLLVSSIELNGNILPVELSVYDVDGQLGLQVPYSPEINALTEMAGNMSQQSGTSLMMTSSAGQQIAADLSRGVVQGISGYFSKKVRTPKITVKAGHQVFLVSKQ